jgi:hypothetical protein
VFRHGDVDTTASVIIRKGKEIWKDWKDLVLTSSI